MKPGVLVHASGVGFYGVRAGDAPLTESAPAGNDFMAEVCVAWEAAAREAAAFGTRVVSTLRLVLGRDGGLLGKLVPIFRSFVGGPLGDGKQVMPWVHLSDVVGAILHGSRRSVAVRARERDGPQSGEQQRSRPRSAAAASPALSGPGFRAAKIAVRRRGAAPILTRAARSPSAARPRLHVSLPRARTERSGLLA